MTDWTRDRILALKSALGMSYSDLGRECEVGSRTVRSWVGGNRDRSPSWQAARHLDRLAKRAAKKERGK
jgi:DNA-binding transcriptional regulator YiaG